MVAEEKNEEDGQGRCVGREKVTECKVIDSQGRKGWRKVRKMRGKECYDYMFIMIL